MVRHRPPSGSPGRRIGPHDGEVIIVTDRGRPVAQLVALPERTSLERGIDEGWVELPRRTHLEAVERVAAARSVLVVLDEDRE